MSETKRIKLLQSGMINKIAAGEVVENPVSVVKELVENSIDAFASSVTIEIKDGGTTFIRITDNGVGIPRDEVKTAFLRHATSKISDIQDLWAVMTLGFRGEALSSIASVSSVEMITRTASELSGYRIEIQDGKVISESDAGTALGTSVIVRDLFYNVPARKKFLKKPNVEAGYISEMVNRLALGHPGVAFKFINNSSVILQTKGNDDPKATIFQVYGKEIFKSSIEVEYKAAGLKVSGYVGKPSIARGNRNYENFFINGRYIKSDLARSVVEDAYRTKLFSGKFPFFVIYLDIDPTAVDVNVHPTKLEVRFSDEALIYKSLNEAVTEALKDNVLIPETKWGSNKSAPMPDFLEATGAPNPKKAEIQTIFEGTGNQQAEPSPMEPKAKAPEKRVIDYIPLTPGTGMLTLSENSDPRREMAESTQKPAKLSEVIYSEKNPPEKIPEENPRSEKIQPEKIQSEKPQKIFIDYKIIGQVFATYWIVERGDKMYLIDQHAAHERILYEKLKKTLSPDKGSISSQRLLEPVLVKLSVSEEQVVKENLSLINEFGFEIEEFGERTYALRSVPYIIKGSLSAAEFIEIVDSLSNISTAVTNIYDTKLEVMATAACKAAVKGNDRLSYIEAKALIEEMMTLDEPFTCPHGRPTIIEMSRYELEKKFMRT